MLKTCVLEIGVNMIQVRIKATPEKAKEYQFRWMKARWQIARAGSEPVFNDMFLFFEDGRCFCLADVVAFHIVSDEYMKQVDTLLSDVR